MEIFVGIVIFGWSLRIIADVLAYVQLWWIKEYRFDRMLVHLGTTQGKRILWPQWKRPPVKPKTILLATSTVTALCALFIFLPFQPIVNIFLADLFSFPLTWGLVFLFYIPTELYHGVLIALAVKKLRSHMPMMVIGITGSYGKTSVKDYLAAILASRFNVLKTEASKNSSIGIAEIILKNLRREHEIFVVEMGAYKRGEIETMTRMVRPEIGIITAINSQHQDLFGTIENTMKAKYELIKSLSGKKIAICNADDLRVHEMGEWARRDGKDVWCWTKKVQRTPFGKTQGEKFKVQSEKVFQATNITSDLEGVKFDCIFEKEKTKIVAPVLGEHQVSNILAAIAGAVACGMNLTEAAKGAAKIKPAKGVMQKIVGIYGSVFIDDTFNNNPDAAKAAISFLAKAKGRKILVFQPMIELGSFSEISHEEVGELAGRICDAIILTNKNFNQSFLTAVRKVSGNIPVTTMGPSKTAAFIKKQVHKGDMVLFKGKEAAHVVNILTR